MSSISSPNPMARLLGRTPQGSNYGSIQPDHHAPGRENSRGSGLRRGLSARQVQMIAIAGTIGTGLFLGTGRSLAEGGPASILICYSIVGFIVHVTLLLLGEMATQYPVAGSFNAYATRFFSPSYGFALAWNYWFNDAVSVASDLTAAQLVLQYWMPRNTWVVSVVFWIFLVGVNALHVKGYGELGEPKLFLGGTVNSYHLPCLRILVVIAEDCNCSPLHNYRGSGQCWSQF
jgi:AAT family amino acid transporter